jgi:hypothetical protein
MLKTGLLCWIVPMLRVILDNVNEEPVLYLMRGRGSEGWE